MGSVLLTRNRLSWFLSRKNTLDHFLHVHHAMPAKYYLFSLYVALSPFEKVHSNTVIYAYISTIQAGFKMSHAIAEQKYVSITL